MAEREGFEPSVEYDPHTRLAGEHHRPARSPLHIISKKYEAIIQKTDSKNCNIQLTKEALF